MATPRNHKRIVDRLSEQMHLNLQKKEELGYPSWLDEKPEALIQWLEEERDELYKALETLDTQRVWEEAADLAAIAAMIADFVEHHRLMAEKALGEALREMVQGKLRKPPAFFRK